MKLLSVTDTQLGFVRQNPYTARLFVDFFFFFWYNLYLLVVPTEGAVAARTTLGA